MWAGQLIGGGLAAAGLLAGVLLAGRSEADDPEGARAANAGRPAEGAFIMDLTDGWDRVNQVRSHWDIDANWLGVSYRSTNVDFHSGGMTLNAIQSRTPIADYSSGELQAVGYYGYGRYEVVMQASDTPGVVSSFFVYTGPDMGDPHDEIDFEFIGRSPRKVHLNHFHKGANDPVDVDLGFNAAQGEHLYAFEWTPNSITWYADGVKLRQVTSANSNVPVPVTTGRVMASVWAANKQALAWVGEPRFTRAKATYRCISHVPLGKKGKQCSDSFKPPARA